MALRDVYALARTFCCRRRPASQVAKILQDCGSRILTKSSRPSGIGQLKLPKAQLSYSRTLDDLLGYQLRRAQEASFNAFAKRAGDSHIWPGWFALLTIIHDNPNINQTALSAASGRDKSTLSASLRELSKAGLINRERDPSDGRSYELSLTTLGKAQFKQLHAHARSHDRRIDEIVGQENKPILLAILKNLAKELSRE